MASNNLFCGAITWSAVAPGDIRTGFSWPQSLGSRSYRHGNHMAVFECHMVAAQPGQSKRCQDWYGDANVCGILPRAPSQRLL